MQVIGFFVRDKKDKILIDAAYQEESNDLKKSCIFHFIFCGIFYNSRIRIFIN